MIDMPTTFFTPTRLAEFWGYVKWFLAYNMPIFMICMAAIVAGLVLDMIIDTVKAADESQKNDDFDIYE